MVEQFNCPIKQRMFYYESIDNNPNNISIDEIRNTYLKLGFNKYKLSGRNEPIVNVVERYVNYLVKPEYKDQVRNYLLLSYFRDVK